MSQTSPNSQTNKPTATQPAQQPQKQNSQNAASPAIINDPAQLPAVQQTNALREFVFSKAFEEQLKKALPTYIRPENFQRAVATSLYKNPDLVNANRQSFLNACMESAQQGLVPDGKEAFINVFFDKKKGPTAQFMPMYQGMLKKMRNHPEFKDCTQQVVYEKDQFEHWTDDQGEHILFKPNRMVDDRGKMKFAFSIIQTKSGGRYIKVMDEKQIASVKKSSRGANSNYSPWNGEFVDQMWCKTVLRRNAKQAPSSSDLDALLAYDDENYDFKQSQSESAGSTGSDGGSDVPKLSRTEKLMGLGKPEAGNPAANAGGNSEKNAGDSRSNDLGPSKSELGEAGGAEGPAQAIIVHEQNSAGSSSQNAEPANNSAGPGGEENSTAEAQNVANDIESDDIPI